VYGTVGGHAYGAVYSGPIGAALMPALDGIAETHHLPEASTFCGRCDAVCPVRIPLTRIMRHWRAVAFATGNTDKSVRRGLKLWAWFAKRPNHYARAYAMASRAMRKFGKGRIRSLPYLRNWFKDRDMPAPAEHSFQAQWRARSRVR
jgi:L-lactate dehydrogenase complex protein LldF